MPLTASIIASTARLATPIINDLYQGAKRLGVRGLLKWNEKTFPAKLARRLHSIEQVKTLWSPEKEISLNEFYHPPRILLNSEKSISPVHPICLRATL